MFILIMTRLKVFRRCAVMLRLDIIWSELIYAFVVALVSSMEAFPSFCWKTTNFAYAGSWKQFPHFKASFDSLIKICLIKVMKQIFCSQALHTWSLLNELLILFLSIWLWRSEEKKARSTCDVFLSTL